MDTPSLRDQINSGDMSSYQVAVVGLCTLINMLDGFDVLVMSFAASSVARDWSLSEIDIGILLSSGLFGMALGSVVIAPFADKVGRRTLVLLCLLIISIGMLGAAIASDQYQLTVLRFVTGLGIGGMLAALSALVSEYANDSKRGLCMSILQSGYPLGAIFGGIISVYLLQEYGWRSLFVFGGLASIAMIPVAYWRLPESIDFMLLSNNRGLSERVEKIAQRIKISNFQTDPNPEQILKTNHLDLLSSEFLRNTICIWLGYFCLMFSFYYVASWTPKLLVDAGLTTTQGVSAGIYLQAGGIIGALILGSLTAYFRVNVLTAIYLFLAVLSMTIYGVGGLGLSGLMICAAIMGFFLIGAMIGLYTIAPVIYPARVRVTGIGTAIGLGRVGGILAPLMGGYMLQIGLQQSHSFFIFSLPLLLACVAVWHIRLPRGLS